MSSLLPPHRRRLLRTAAVCLAVAAIAVAPTAAQDEIIYLTNTRVSDDSGQQVTQLYLVDIDEAAGRADVSLLDEVPLEKVDALACAPDDRHCYLLDRYDPILWPNGGMMGVYETETGTLTLMYEVVDGSGALIPGVVLAGHEPGPDGRLLIGSQDTDHLYTLDLDTGIATSLGPIYVAGTLTQVDLNGADLVFTSDRRLFVWANSGRLPDAPFGLYEVDLPEIDGGVAIGVFLGGGSDGSDPGSNFFTGLAVRKNGLGEIVGSNRFDELHVQSRDGDDLAVYDLMRDGSPLGHFAGDMHHSFDCFMETSLDRDVAAPGETVTLTNHLIHNRPRTVHTWFDLEVVEIASGEVVAHRTSKTKTLKWGETLTFDLKIPIPAEIRPGTYEFRMTIDDMRQGSVTKTATLEIRP